MSLTLRTFFGCIVMWLGLTAMGIMLTGSSSEPEYKPNKVIHVKTRAEKIEDQFSGWDGRHFKAAEAVKDRMHDPDSFEHHRTVYYIKTNTIKVVMSYYGKNLFGAKVRTTTTAIINIKSGDVISLN